MMQEVVAHKLYQCKYCKKKFVCGRSLGGHMRSHLSNGGCGGSGGGGSSSDQVVMERFEVGGHIGYGLRENPKKNCRLSDPGKFKSKVKLCTAGGGKGNGGGGCGGDQLSKSHSQNNESWTSTTSTEDRTKRAELVLADSLSENEAVVPRKKRRSRRSRYKSTTDNFTNAVNVTSATVTTSSSVSEFANVSTSISGFEIEVKECAMCLMILSQDIGHWSGLDAVAKSSINNSLMLEGGSVSIVKGIDAWKAGSEISCDVDETLRMIKHRGKKRRSGFGIKRVDSEVSVYGFTGGDIDEYKEHSLEYKEGLEIDGMESGEILFNETDEYQTDLMNKFGSLGKRNKFECGTCNKIFHSYQALGGHRASHKRIKGCIATKVEFDVNSIETSIDISLKRTPEIAAYRTPDSKQTVKSFNFDSAPQSAETSSSPAKKTKFECPICYRVFSSGQGLGGHKRSHAVGTSSEVKGTESIVIQQQQQQIPEFHNLLDLNLPAPSEEVTVFKPWWIGSNQQFELMSGLISN